MSNNRPVAIRDYDTLDEAIEAMKAAEAIPLQWGLNATVGGVFTLLIFGDDCNLDEEKRNE